MVKAVPFGSFVQQHSTVGIYRKPLSAGEDDEITFWRGGIQLCRTLQWRLSGCMDSYWYRQCKSPSSCKHTSSVSLLLAPSQVKEPVKTTRFCQFSLLLGMGEHQNERPGSSIWLSFWEPVAWGLPLPWLAASGRIPSRHPGSSLPLSFGKESLDCAYLCQTGGVDSWLPLSHRQKKKLKKF